MECGAPAPLWAKAVLEQFNKLFGQFHASSLAEAQRATPSGRCFQTPNELVALKTGGMAAFGPLLPHPLPLPLWWAREGLPDVRLSRHRLFISRNSSSASRQGELTACPTKSPPRMACTAAETVQKLHIDATFDCPRSNSVRGSPSSLSHWNGRGKRGRPPQAAGVIGEGIKRQMTWRHAFVRITCKCARAPHSKTSTGKYWGFLGPALT